MIQSHLIPVAATSSIAIVTAFLTLPGLAPFLDEEPYNAERGHGV
jgi:hypothetical protein